MGKIGNIRDSSVLKSVISSVILLTIPDGGNISEYHTRVAAIQPVF
jgi:hypothetical protein